MRQAEGRVVVRRGQGRWGFSHGDEPLPRYPPTGEHGGRRAGKRESSSNLRRMREDELGEVLGRIQMQRACGTQETEHGTQARAVFRPSHSPGRWHESMSRALRRFRGCVPPSASFCASTHRSFEVADRGRRPKRTKMPLRTSSSRKTKRGRWPAVVKLPMRRSIAQAHGAERRDRARMCRACSSGMSAGRRSRIEEAGLEPRREADVHRVLRRAACGVKAVRGEQQMARRASDSTTSKSGSRRARLGRTDRAVIMKAQDLDLAGSRKSSGLTSARGARSSPRRTGRTARYDREPRRSGSAHATTIIIKQRVAIMGVASSSDEFACGRSGMRSP